MSDKIILNTTRNPLQFVLESPPGSKKFGTQILDSGKSYDIINFRSREMLVISEDVFAKLMKIKIFKYYVDKDSLTVSNSMKQSCEMKKKLDKKSKRGRKSKNSEPDVAPAIDATELTNRIPETDLPTVEMKIESV